MEQYAINNNVQELIIVQKKIKQNVYLLFLILEDMLLLY